MCLNGLTVQWPVMSCVWFEPSCADQESNRFQAGGEKRKFARVCRFLFQDEINYSQNHR